MNEEELDPETFKDYDTLRTFFASSVRMKVLRRFMKDRNTLIFSAYHSIISDRSAMFLYNNTTLNEMGDFLLRRVNPYIGGYLVEFPGDYEEMRELFSRYDNEFLLENKDRHRTIMNIMEIEENKAFKFKVQYTRRDPSFYLFKELKPRVDLKCSKLNESLYLITIYLLRYSDFVAVRDLFNAINREENGRLNLDAFELLSTVSDHETRDKKVSKILSSLESIMDIVGVIGFKSEGKSERPLSENWIENVTKMSGEQKIQSISRTLQGLRKDELMANALDLLLFDRENSLYRIHCDFNKVLQLKYKNCKLLDGVMPEDITEVKNYEEFEEEPLSEKEKIEFLEKVWEKIVSAYSLEFPY